MFNLLKNIVMKKVAIINPIKKFLKQLTFLAVISLLHLAPKYVNAQTDTAAATVAEAPEMISPSLEFLSVQKTDNTIDLKATLKAKVNGSSVQLPLLKVKFIYVGSTEEKELGFVITNRNGKAVFNAKTDSLLPGEDGKLHFKASFAGNNAMDPIEEELFIKRARLEITPLKQDSLLNVSVKLVEIGTGIETPVPQTAIGVFVKRMFLPLKVGEGTTDDNGEAIIEFPNNLPGDEQGKLTVLAKLDESELYGNLEASVVIPNWGIPVSKKIEDQPRALWSSHPPLWMLITFIVLMLAVWGHYIVIVYELFRLRKEQPPVQSNATNS
jgi:hypothetical protein